MKALLLTADDGLSPEIWLQTVLGVLKGGRPVLAITDVANASDAIGKGDDLPCYPQTLTENPLFTNRKVRLEDAPTLLEKLHQLPSDAVVFWNMSVFDWASRDPQWMLALDSCANAPQDMLFVHYYHPHSWGRAITDASEALLGRVSWGYVAGAQLMSPDNREGVLALFPTLATALKSLPAPTAKSSWQVVTSQGAATLALTGPCEKWTQLPELQATLAWSAHSSNNGKSPGSAPRPLSRTEKLVMGGSLALVGPLMLWGLVGVCAQAWLAWNVPLTAQDLKYASWLGSPSLALHFTTGLANLLSVTLLAMATVIAVLRRTAIPAFMAIFFVLAGQLGMGDAAVVRMGVLDGTVKVGCYVPETRECRNMLGLSVDSHAPSMYPSTEEAVAHPNEAWSAWYRDARAKVVSTNLEHRALWTDIPGAVILEAPLHLGEAARLRRLLAAQRAEVAKMQKEGPRSQ